jgi:hypothetical protein
LAANAGKNLPQRSQRIQGERSLKINLQLFEEWLKLVRLLDNLSFQGMENLQVNVVQ